jgi:glutathione S-transferase/GST-like protein
VDAVEVYTWEPNANSGKPLFALHEKGVPFTHHYIDMGVREHHEPAYLAINPAGTIPTVIHGGLRLTESTPAMEYIDDAFEGPPLRPADPTLRWRMRWIMRVMDNSVCPALAMVASNRLAAPRFRETPEDEKRAALAKIPDPARRRTWELLMHDATPAQEIAESERRVDAGLALLERMLAEHRYLAGPEFSLADICVMASFYHLPISRPDEVTPERMPHLWDWLRRCHARPGMQAGFAMGRGFITARAGEARERLGVPS